MNDLMRGIAIQSAPDLRVLSLIVLPYHHEVYVLWTYVCERTPNAVEELHGP
jgi:hypothetical protein